MSSEEWSHVRDGPGVVQSHDMDDERRVRLAYAIRAARERRGMTPQQLADAAGVAHSTVYGWESGDKAPSILMLGPLCDALGVSPDLFRDLPEEPPSPVEAYLSEAARQGVREGVRRRRQ